MLVSLIASLMCSTPEEDIIPPTSSEDTTITIEERMEVFEACKKKSVELNNLEGLEDRINSLHGWQHNRRSILMVLSAKIFTPFLLMAALSFCKNSAGRRYWRKDSHGRSFFKPAPPHKVNWSHGRLAKGKKSKLVYRIGCALS